MCFTVCLLFMLDNFLIKIVGDTAVGFLRKKILSPRGCLSQSLTALLGKSEKREVVDSKLKKIIEPGPIPVS
jgi:hypothetical protein